jgi:HlyD family secretion protein
MLDKPPQPGAASAAPPGAPARIAARRADVAAILGKGRSRGLQRRLIIGAIVLAVAVAGGWWWFGRSGTSAVTYTTVPVTRGDLVVSVNAAGTIQPINQVDVSSELSGTVASVAVTYNTKVKAGQILATLKTDRLAASVEQGKAQLAAREADVAQAKAAADQTATALNRAKQLRAMGTVTQEALDTAQSAADKATAALAAADANRQIAVANLSITQSDLAKTSVTSPIDGVVLNRNVEVGQTVAASLSAPILFTLAEDLTKMRLEVNIDEADVGTVNEGDTAAFTVAAFADRAFPATVSQVRFAPAKVEGVVTYKAILSVDNTSLLLRPGMTATATITVDSVSGALLVPNAALRYTPPAANAGLLGGLIRTPGGPPPGGGAGPGGGNAVFIGPGGAGPGGAGAQPARVVPPPGAVQAPRVVWVLRDGKPVAVPVRTGVTDGSRTQILGGGLTADDVVITGSKAA